MAPLSTLPPIRCWAAVATPKPFFCFSFFILLIFGGVACRISFTSLANTPQSGREGNSLFLAEVEFFFFSSVANTSTRYFFLPVYSSIRPEDNFFAKFY